MKRLIIIPTVLLSTLLFSNELAWVDEQIEAIKPPRDGMSSVKLSKIKSPFIFLKKSEEKKLMGPPSKGKTLPSVMKVQKRKQILTLSLILNNKAMINDIWYKKGDKINGYTITELNSKSVLLQKNQKQLLLSTKSNSKNLKFKNK